MHAPSENKMCDKDFIRVFRLPMIHKKKHYSYKNGQLNFVERSYISGQIYLRGYQNLG